MGFWRYFYGVEESSCWIFSIEKYFRVNNIVEDEEKMKVVAMAMRGCALKWWLWRIQPHPSMSWNIFTEIFFWHFKPKWRHFFMDSDEEIEEEEEEEPDLVIEPTPTVEVNHKQNHSTDDGSYWDNGLPLIPNSSNIASHVFENLGDTVKDETPQQPGSCIQKPNFTDVIQKPSLTETLSSSDHTTQLTSIFDSSSVLMAKAPFNGNGFWDGVDFSIPAKPPDSSFSTTTVKSHDATKVIHSRSQSESTNSCEENSFHRGSVVDAAAEVVSNERVQDFVNSHPIPRKIDLESPTVMQRCSLQPLTILVINVKLVVETQFKDEGFYDDADFAIPPKPPDQIFITRLSPVLPCISKQSIQLCIEKEEVKAFLSFMKGKAPQTILTDHNMWLKEAIAVEMPETKHAFCIWHILSKFSDWFSLLLGSQYDEWKAEFHRLYNLEMVEDFEQGWRQMVDNYGLHANKHIISLYSLRTFWALPFLRLFFFAGFTSTNQTESVNVFIQRFLSAQSQPERFLEQVADIVDFNDRAGVKQKMQRKTQKVILKTGSPIESHAATILTPYALNKLQEELVSAPQYASLMVDEGSFQVRHHSQTDGGCKVLWLPCQEHISCSCHLFEFSGILCKHVLRVMSTNNCFHIPDQYLPLRWRTISSSSVNHFQGASGMDQPERIQFLESLVSTLLMESVETDERLDVACDQVSVVISRIKTLPRSSHAVNDITFSYASDSLILPEVEDTNEMINGFTISNPHDSMGLGKLKERRVRDGVDLTRKRRQFSTPLCVQYGHDGSDCSIMADDNISEDALGYM